MDYSIREISTKDTYPIRGQVLNPNLSGQELHRPGDDQALHFGIFQENKLVGVVSLYQENIDELPAEGHWRIRGMAVKPEQQGKSIGSRLLKFVLDELGDYKQIWCKSRGGAVDFYKRFGLEVIREVEPSQDHRNYLMST